jgi:hypothetical protein
MHRVAAFSPESIFIRHTQQSNQQEIVVEFHPSNCQWCFTLAQIVKDCLETESRKFKQNLTWMFIHWEKRPLSNIRSESRKVGSTIRLQEVQIGLGNSFLLMAMAQTKSGGSVYGLRLNLGRGNFGPKDIVDVQKTTQYEVCHRPGGMKAFWA